MARLSRSRMGQSSKATVRAAAALIAQGEWCYGTANFSETYDLTAGTNGLISSVTASTSDLLLPFVRFRFAFWNESDAEKLPMYVAVVKYLSTGSPPEVDQPAECEKAKADGTLFHRELVVWPGTGAPTKMMNLEFRNVRLIASERLALVINPLKTKADINYVDVVDYRKVEV